MPRYQYTCTACGWTGDRTTTIAQRDEQTCDVYIKSMNPKDSMSDHTCGGALTREEVSLTAKMSHSWMP